MLTGAAAPGVAPATVPPGDEVLPGYRVVGLLARGGRVDTYDAVSLERACRCVVKVVRPDRLDEPHVTRALLTEGRLLTGLSHPHLVRGYDVVVSPPGLVLEALPGATLDAVLDDGPLGVADAAELGRQLASALGYLHGRGWVHLDVKPENVVVTDGGRAVLLDLGVAARPGRPARGTGTPGYLAPEQDGAGVVTAACDSWGWAATLVEAVTGDVPGPDPDLGRVPAAVRGLLRDCLHPDPACRPTMAAVRERLDRGPLRATPDATEPPGQRSAGPGAPGRGGTTW